jgi:hypothetical protein
MLKRFGSRLHQEKVQQVVQAMCEYKAGATGVKRGLLHSYIAGYLGHYSLDSIAHPFIYSQQYAICAAGIAGLDEQDGSIVHGQIEADIDSMMLFRHLGKTVSNYRPAREFFRLDSAWLSCVDALYSYVAAEVFGMVLPARAFSRCFNDMRLTLETIYSRRGIKRVLLGYAERAFRRHSLLQALSTRDLSYGTALVTPEEATCDFCNQARGLWINPFTGDTSQASFLELFAAGVKNAQARARQLEQGAHAANLDLSLNFEGSPCP